MTKNTLKFPAAALAVMLLITTAGCGKKVQVLKVSGTIEIKEIDIASRIASRVVKFHADEGQSVKQGGILCELDDRLVKAQKASATALLVNAKDNFDRNRKLFATGSISKQQFEQIKASYDKAVADQEQTSLMAEEALLSAPWDGVVTSLNVEEGELVSAFTPILTFGDLTHVKIKVYVNMKELALVKPGQKCLIRIDAFQKKTYPGIVTTIADKAEFTPKNIQTKDERVKEVFAVTVTALNPDLEMKPGMAADVQIATR
jgi:HlyD family secretion protein